MLKRILKNQSEEEKKGSSFACFFLSYWKCDIDKETISRD